MLKASYSLSNQLLSALTEPVLERLRPYLEEVSLIQGQILHKSSELITEVYFPEQSSVSLVLILSDKSTTEIGLVGKEGMVGLSAILGGKSTTSHSIVQIAGTAVKLPSQILQEEFNRGEELQKLFLLYTQAQLTQIAQIAVCQSHHVIEQRLARWLLLVRNCTNRNTLPLTQKSISMMLGVRRASVTEAAISLQQAEIINYSRGQIVITDPQKLESVACECYEKIQREYTRLLSQKLNQ
jgi:CRP-like cAMP-binding protein